MAVLFNINDLFAIDSSGAMEISGGAGAATYVLMSNGAGNANSWYDVQSKFGEYLPLTGGTLTGNLAINGTNSLSVGGVTTLNDLDVTDTLAWRVSPTDVARQRADARDDATNFARLHWFGKSDNASTSNFRHAYYDGANYINVTAASGAVTFDGILAATGGNSTEWNTSYDNSITALAVTGTTTKTLTATQQDGGTLTASWTDNNTGTVTSSATASYIPYMSTATNVANSQLLYDTASSRTILTSTVGPNDDIRGSFVVRDDTAMAANVGGQIALGYKYLSSGGYTEGALIRTYKLNATSGDYSSGLKIQVRNTGVGLSTKFTLDPSGNVTIPGIYNATGGTSTEWNTAYDNSITGLAVTGTTTKTLTATQQDGGTLTASWTDNDSNTSWPNVGAGIRTNYTLGFKPPANGYAGFYFQTSDAAGAGYLLIRGESGSGAYTDQGISLIADAGWLSLVSRITTDKGVRIMSGATAAERLVITSAGDSYFNGNLGIGVTTLTGNGGLMVTNTEGVFANANQKRVASFYDGSVNSERPGIILGYDDSSTPHGIIAARTQSGTSTIPGLQFFTFDGSSWGAKMTILANGRVGIGNINPAYKLTVSGSSSDWNTAFIVNSSTTGTGLSLRNTSTGVTWSEIAQGTGGGANDNNLAWHLTAAGTSGEALGYKMTLTPSGNLGIGTDPEQDLHIKRDGEAAVIYLERINNNAGYLLLNGSINPQIAYPHNQDLRFATVTNSSFDNFSPKMTLTSAGYLLINRTSNATNQPLQVEGFIDITNVDASAMRVYNGSTFRGGFGMSRWGVGASNVLNDADMVCYAVGNLDFVTNGQSFASVRVNTYSNLIVTGGTHAFNGISTYGGISINVPSGTKKYVSFWDSGTTTFGGGMWYDEASNITSLYSLLSGVQTQHVQLDRATGNTWINASSGNVYIGDTTTPPPSIPAPKFYVNGSSVTISAIGPNDNIRTGLAHYDSTTGNGANIGGQIVLGYRYSGNTYTEGAIIKMYKTNSTNGDYSSGLKFQVRNNGDNLTAKMDLSPSGTLTVIQDIVAYGSPSDKKLKENIKPISLALDKVTKLQGVTFDWKESDSMLNIKEDIGFIAQDVQKVVPELVRKNSNGLLSMRHQGVIPMLVEAIKELESRVKELENK